MRRCIKVLTGILVVATVLFITTLPALAVQNALRQDIEPKCNLRYTGGAVTWTNVNLNTAYGGTYNRIGLTRQTVANPIQHATTIAEIGWAKNIWLGGLVVQHLINITYTDVNGNAVTTGILRPQMNYHYFSVQYDPVSTNKWHFFADGQLVTGQGYVTNFDKACAAFAGGEVQSHVEDMGNTNFYALGRAKINGQGVMKKWSYWLTNTIRLFQGRYSCTLNWTMDITCGP